MIGDNAREQKGTGGLYCRLRMRHGWRAAAAFALMLVSSGCHAPDPIEAHASDANVCRLDLSGTKGRTVFFLLGLMQDYDGRGLVEGDNRVETFFCSESESARLFGKYADVLIREQNLAAKVETKTAGTCVVSYHSVELTTALNSCYRHSFKNARSIKAEDGSMRRVTIASLDFTSFLESRPAGESPEITGFQAEWALAYLAGAWRRSGEEGRGLVFTDTSRKPELLRRLLVRLGCRTITLEDEFGMVFTRVVRFEPTEEMTRWIQMPW